MSGHDTSRFRPVKLETARFLLEPVKPWPFSRLSLPWTDDAESMGELGWKRNRWTRLRWWMHLRRHNRRAMWCLAITPKGHARPIGLHTLKFDTKVGVLTTGVLIGDRTWWGKGVVGEVREAILADAFTRIGIQRSVGVVRARNFPSIFNYQRLGYTVEGTLRRHFAGPDGQSEDAIFFGMLREEWEERAARLAAASSREAATMPVEDAGTRQASS
jgi:[ribosomal protein S5]-alanine N-acetyltransferase